MAKFAIENLDINKNRHNFAPLKNSIAGIAQSVER